MSRTRSTLKTILFTILFFVSSHAQAEVKASIEELKAAYIFNFLKYVRWPNEDRFEALRVGFIGNDLEYLEKCKEMQSRSIRSKSIVVHHIQEPADVRNYQVIVTSKDQNNDLANIARVLYNKETLLITDAVRDKQLTMINFTYPNPEYVAFEVNRYNFLYEGLQVSSDILLLGGTELDIANLLREMETNLSTSQQQLREQSQKLQEVLGQVRLREQELQAQDRELEALQAQIRQKEKEVSEGNQKILQQAQELNTQERQLSQTKADLETFKSELLELESSLMESRLRLDSNTSLLAEKEKEIGEKESSIENLSLLINQNKQLLADQNKRIQNQAASLRQQEEDLATQTQAIEGQLSIIRKQSNVLLIVGASLIFVLILAFVMYRNNRAKQNANAKLERTNRLLRDTQGQLVESEKMAALGGLVAGVAHEINTPLGVSVTAVSHLDHAIANFQQQYQAGNLKRSELEAMLSDAAESTAILTRNLNRASELISNFKQVAADQTAEEVRVFELNHYLGEVCQSLIPKLRPKGHRIEIDCPEVELNTYPGALAQVITNMVMNSMVHGFEDMRDGLIRINVVHDHENITIDYQDFGCGIREDQIARIFDPFYTTKRAKGGTGLGMHISYNLVTQNLGGKIQCIPSEYGARFRIEFPVEVDVDVACDEGAKSERAEASTELDKDLQNAPEAEAARDDHLIDTATIKKKRSG